MAAFALQVRPYCRPFRQPLQTSGGLWRERRGAIVRLAAADGRVGWGEIAPLPAFGSESLTGALQFCHSLGDTVTHGEIERIPVRFPACQFAFESALADLSAPVASSAAEGLARCYLLPTGAAACEAWQAGWAGGARTFKWKIGVRNIQTEIREFQALAAALPPGAKLRLDANGGLDFPAAEMWLRASDRALDCVEFCEQPLPANQFAELQRLAATHQTPIALDESVATLGRLRACYAGGWRGIYTIKAAIVGSPRQLRQFCGQHPIDAVFSSAFEGAIGRRAALRLAGELGSPWRAVGFGTDRWLEPEVPVFS